MEYQEHYSYRDLVKTSLPVAAMLLFTSIYGCVDGLFVSNLVGKKGFTAVNLVIPYLMFFGGFGFIFGSGGSALIGKLLGEGEKDRANRVFSSLTRAAFVTGIGISLLGIAFLPSATTFFGAKGGVRTEALSYGRIYLLGTPFFVMQLMFESLYSTAGKRKLGLYSTMICGVLNIILDAVLIGGCHLGIQGAAAATVFSQATGALIPFFYFRGENDSCLRLVRCAFDGKSIIKACGNGLSEMVNNVTLSIVSMVYNVQLLKYGGNNAVSAYGVCMYTGFFFNAVLYGFITAVSPLISYHYGAENTDELKSLLKKCVVILMAESVMVFGFANLFNARLSAVFVGYDKTLLALTVHGFKKFSLWFLANGLAVFGSCFFTALNNGVVSAKLSFLRVIGFQLPCGVLLPRWYGVDGIFIAVFVAELLTIFLTAGFLLRYRKRYNYF